MTAPDTINDSMIAAVGDTLRPAFPLVLTTRQQAYRAAAWIEAMALVLPEQAGQEGVTFDAIRAAVADT